MRPGKGEAVEYVAGIDLGGSSAKIGLVDRQGRILARGQVGVDPVGAPDAIIARIAAGVRDLASRLSSGARMIGAGIGAPGFVDSEAGRLVGCENLPGLMDAAVPRLFSDKLGVPAFLENDANCAAGAELSFGAGRNFRSLILVTVGTGIGGGLVLDGRVWRGARGFAGEIGHLCLDPLGPWCPCGSRGCLEQYAAGPAIVRLYQWRARGRGSSSQGAALGSAMPLAATAEEVARRAAGGDEAAQRAFAEAGRALAQAFGAVLNLLNLEACLVGGGVSAAGDVLLDPVRKSLPDYVYPLVAERVKVIAAGLGNDAGLLGAAALALERMGA